MENAVQKNLELLKNKVMPESLTVCGGLTKKGIPELVSGSSTKVVNLIKKESLFTNNQQRCVEDPRLQPSGMTPKRITATVHGFASALVTPPCFCAGYSAQKQNGFTLIELLVVVLIIGILAAVALPQYQKAVHKSHGTEVLAAADALVKGVNAYYMANGTYSGINKDALDIQVPTLKYFRYLQSGCNPHSGSNEFQGLGYYDYDYSVFFFPLFMESGVPDDWEPTLQLVFSRGEDFLVCHDKSNLKKCQEYFNCTTDTLSLQVGTGTATFTGCFIKK